jgi:Divergent InlB B-repeat domain
MGPVMKYARRRGAVERGRRRPGWRLGLIAAVSCVVCGLVAWSAPALGDSPLSWSSPVAIDSPNALYAVSCPSASLCVAVDSAGNVVTATDPVHGPWAVASVDHILDSISCPSTSLCVAVDGGFSGVDSSTNPTGGSGAWTHTAVQIQPQYVSCPSISLCVAADHGGDIITSTNPGAASPTWSAPAQIDQTSPPVVYGLSCPSTTLCVATDGLGNVWSTTDPTGTGAWASTDADGTTPLTGISCPSTSLCVAGDQAGQVLTSTNPGSATPVWTAAHVDATNVVFAVSCASGGLCAATDQNGNVITSTNPTGGAAAWTLTPVDGSTTVLYGISCASLSLCVATDQNGFAVTGTSSSPQYTLSVALAGTGSGTVTGDQPPKIACPGACSQQYPAGTQITLTETPSAGSTFAGWSGGGCPATNTTCTVTLGADTPVTATFSASSTGGGGTPPVPAISVKLTATIYGDGIGSVHDNYGHTCSKSTAATAPCPPVYYPYGTTVVLGGSASGSATFSGFLGGGCPSFATTCTITMNGDQTVNAYIYKPQEVSVTLGGTGGGGVTGTPSIGGCGKPQGATGAVCIRYFPWGTAITLHATPDPGSEFSGWSGGCHGTGDCYLNTAFGTQAVGATFSPAEVHVNAIEITQGVQTPELPTRTSASDTTVSYHGVAMPGSNGNVITQLAAGHPTVVRVYANSATALSAVPAMRLSAYRGGRLLAPGPIGPDFQPPTIPVGALGSVTTAGGLWQRSAPYGAYTFTLPPGWISGDVRFVADANPVPNAFPGCSDTSCLDRGLILDGTHFTPVHTTTINPIAFLDGLSAPKNYPGPDPMWDTIRQLFPFPIQVNPYVQVTGEASVLGTCDGQTQDTVNNESNAAFAQRVYAARNGSLSTDVENWQTANVVKIGYAFGVAPSGSPTTCTNAGSYTGGVTGHNPATGDVISASSDDRPKGAAHEIGHAVLGTATTLAPHAGVECGGGSDPGTDGISTTLNADTTNGSSRLTGLSQPSLVQALSPGQVIEGAGVPYGTTIQSIDTAANAVTMSAPATSSNGGAYAFPLSGYVTKGSTQLTNLSPQLVLPYLGVGEQISGPGVPDGATIQSIGVLSGTITMSAAATSTNGGLFTFLNDDILNSNQTGEAWPQLVGATNFVGGSFADTFTASTGATADGALDGIGLAGLGDQSKSPYRILYNATLPLPPPLSEYYDILAYCGGENTIWISVRNWNRAVAYATGAAVGTARDSATAAGPVQGYQTTPPASSGQTRTLAVTDVYDLGSGRSLATTVSPDAGGPTAVQPGDMYSLAARDASGRVIARAGAIASLVHIDHQSSQLLIVGKVPAAGAREVDVLQDGRPIAQERASRSAPTVTITSPRGGARIGGPRGAVLRWRSHDADGDQLTVIVRYSPNGGRTWRSIYSGPDTGSVKLPSYLLSASHAARVRIYVSDGFYEAITTSRRFVALGAPPIVSIMTPTRGTRVAAGGALALAGNAYDDTGRPLTGHALTWRAGRRVIATGEQAAVVDLPAGHYRITLTARDRHGRTASASVPVTVTPSPPTLKLLRAPERLSSRARSLRISLATLAPAKVAVGRMHALVGRSPRTLRVAIRPGRTPLAIVLTLRSGPYVSRVAIAVVR